MKKGILMVTTLVILAGSGLYAYNNQSKSSCKGECCKTETCCNSGSCETECTCGSECSGDNCECGCSCCE